MPLFEVSEVVSRPLVLESLWLDLDTAEQGAVVPLQSPQKNLESLASAIVYCLFIPGYSGAQ